AAVPRARRRRRDAEPVQRARPRQGASGRPCRRHAARRGRRQIRDRARSGHHPAPRRVSAGEGPPAASTRRREAPPGPPPPRPALALVTRDQHVGQPVTMNASSAEGGAGAALSPWALGGVIPALGRTAALRGYPGGIDVAGPGWSSPAAGDQLAPGPEPAS